MRAIPWLAGGLVIVALAGAGDSAQSLTGTDLFPTAEGATAVKGVAVPQQPPVAPVRQIPPPPPPPPIVDPDLFHIEIPDIPWPDIEWQDLAWADIDLEQFEWPDIEWPEFDVEFPEFDLDWSDFDLEWQDFQVDVPRIDFEFDLRHVMDVEHDIHIDVPEIHVDLSDLRFGRTSRLELLEMTYQQQGDPGLATFNEAKTLIFDEKYQEARERLMDLIRQYANSAYVDDAYFWASYALEQMRGQTEAAFKSYEEFVNSYPQSPFVEHAQAAMVNLAGRLYRMGMEQYRSYVESAREEGETEIQLLALQEYIRMEGVDSIPILEAVLTDGSKPSSMKQRVVDLLRRLEDDRAVPILERTARQHADPEVRARAIASFGSRRDAASLQALTRLYEGERSVNARRYIADAAGNFRETDSRSEAAAFLSRIARNDQDEEVRSQALSELATFESGIAMPHLTGLLEQTTDSGSRRLLLRAITRSEDPSRIQILVREARSGSDEQLQRYAVDYLGSIEGPEALDALIGIARADLSEAVRVQAVDEIGNFEGSKATEALIALARAGSPVSVADGAIDELGNRQTSEVFAVLREVATGTGETELRRSALSEMRAWGAEAAPVLERVALNDPEERLRRDAVSALGSLENGAGWDGLVRVFQSDAETRIRTAALDYLWRINEERSLDTVIGAAKTDGDAQVRRHAVQMLGRSESEKARAALREILDIPPAGAS